VIYYREITIECGTSDKKSRLDAPEQNCKDGSDNYSVQTMTLHEDHSQARVKVRTSVPDEYHAGYGRDGYGEGLKSITREGSFEVHSDVLFDCLRKLLCNEKFQISIRQAELLLSALSKAIADKSNDSSK